MKSKLTLNSGKIPSLSLENPVKLSVQHIQILEYFPHVQSYTVDAQHAKLQDTNSNQRKGNYVKIVEFTSEMRARACFLWVNPSVIIKGPDTRASPETAAKCLCIFINTKFNKILGFHLKNLHLTPVSLGAKHLNWTKPAIPSYMFCPTGLCSTGFYKSWKVQWQTS